MVRNDSDGPWYIDPKSELKKPGRFFYRIKPLLPLEPFMESPWFNECCCIYF
jgi:hypothetical protein